MLLGEQYAENLGFPIRKLRIALLVITGMLTAVVTAFCGPIAFIGLATPHIARLLVGTENHRQRRAQDSSRRAAVCLDLCRSGLRRNLVVCGACAQAAQLRPARAGTHAA